MSIKKTVQITATLFALILLPLMQVSGEKIFSISENSFETAEKRMVIAPELFAGTTEFIFESSTALRGRVEIFSSNRKEIEIIYHKVLFAETRQQADSFAQIISLNYEVSSNSLVLNASAPRNAPWRKSANLSGQIECEIYIPESYTINVDLAGYYLNIRGPFPEAEIVASYCDEIRVSRIELGLKLNSANSSVNLKDINGPALVKSEGGNISARNVNSGLGIASFENSGGAISVIGFTGDELHCEAEEGKINLEKIRLVNNARAYISNSGINSDIYIDVEEIIDSHLEVFNKTADIQFLLPRDISASFEISTDPDVGEIEVSGVPLVTEEVEWGSLLAHTPEHHSTIVADTRGRGKINLRRKDF